MRLDVLDGTSNRYHLAGENFSPLGLRTHVGIVSIVSARYGNFPSPAFGGIEVVREKPSQPFVSEPHACAAVHLKVIRLVFVDDLNDLVVAIVDVVLRDNVTDMDSRIFDLVPDEL